MKIRWKLGSKFTTWSAVLVVAAVAVTTAVLAQSMPGKAEITDTGHSWPHEVNEKADGSGKTMAQMLTEIHEAALTALSAAPASPPDMRQHITIVLRRTAVCLAYDGHMPAPTPAPPTLPSHSGVSGANAAHAGAMAKVIAAHKKVFPTDGTAANWDGAGQELDHGH